MPRTEDHDTSFAPPVDDGHDHVATRSVGRRVRLRDQVQVEHALIFQVNPRRIGVLASPTDA
jgi:hypothetical protein